MRISDWSSDVCSSDIGTFGRMPLAGKKGALGQLGQMLPAGFEIVERGQREQRTAPDPVAAQLREALQASFDIIARLAFADDVDPEPVEDEEIEAARRLGQRVLMETAALFRTPEGEKA